MPNRLKHQLAMINFLNQKITLKRQAEFSSSVSQSTVHPKWRKFL